MRPTELLQFAIKAELKERPMIVMSIFLILSVIVSAFILRAAEMPADEENGDRFGFSYIWNSMWCSFITIATVGYGDIFPVSTMGKIICVIIMFWGNFLISLIIVSLANLVEFEREEAKAYF
jgi:voltage-gated potassium channel